MMDKEYKYSSEEEIKSFFANFMTKNKVEFDTYLDEVKFYNYKLDEWAYYIYKNNADLSLIFDEICEEFYKNDDYDNRFRKFHYDKQNKIITKIVKRCCEKEYQRKNGGLVNKLNEVHFKTSKWKDSTPASKEKMLHMINNDITVLRDVFTKAVLKEIDIEKSFNGALANNTEIIASAAENKHFSDWILRNVWKIYVNEYAMVATQQKERDLRKRISDNIKKGLEEL